MVGLLDLGLLFWCLCTLVAACWRVVKGFEDETPSEDLVPISLNKQVAVVAPVAASVVLLTAYFFPSGIFWICTASFASFAVVGLPFILKPATKSCVPDESKRWLVLAGATAVLVVAWLATGYWFLHDFLTSVVIVFILVMIRSPNAKLFTTLFVGITLYDIFWVFYSNRLFGGDGVMIEVASQKYGYMYSPGVFIFPSGGGDFLLLGAGDVTIPGIAVCTMVRFDYYRNVASHRRSYPHTLAALLGFSTGLLLSNYMLATLQFSQPALMYLAPLTTAFPLLLAWYRGCFCKLWNGWELDEYHTIPDVEP